MALLRNLLILSCSMVLTTTAAAADLNVHGALKGGWTDLDYGDGDFPAGTDVDSTDHTFSILAGLTFPVARDRIHLGGEIAQTYLGEYTAEFGGADEDVKLYGSEVVFAGFFDVATGTQLFVRAGGWAWESDVDHGDDDSGFDPVWGAGFTYGLDNLLFRGEANRYDAEDETVDAYTVGLQYQFL